VGATDPASAYGLKSGSRKRRRDEDPAAFIKRIVKTFPKVIAQCRGDLPTAALVFGVQLPMMEDIVAAHRPKLGRPYSKARALAAAEAHRSVEEADAARKELMAEVEEKDRRLKRKYWPTDEDQRRSDIHDALIVSLIENEGDVAETSSCLNVPIHEINEMMEGDEDLLGARAAGLRVQAVKAESALFKGAQSGNNVMVKMVLTNLLGDQWSERQQVDVRRVGFAPPDDKEAEEGSVLQLIKGVESDA
jgi:hypothetical protein